MLLAPESPPPPPRSPPAPARRPAKTTEKPGHGAHSPLPRWAFAPESQSRADVSAAHGAGLRAGAVLLALDGVVRAEPTWIGHFRSVQALTAASAAARKLRLRADEASLRDVLHLTQAGADPGPAGRLYGAWNWLSRHPAHAAAGGLARLAAALGLAPVDAPIEAFARRGADPIAAAAEVAAAVVRGDDKPADLAAREMLAWMAADIALALQLGWSVPVALFGAALGEPNLRAALGDRTPRPGDADWPADAYVVVAHAAANAYAKSIQIDRRAGALVAAAAGLRTKGAEAGLAALLGEESVAPWALAKTMGSDRAARRFCDRLVELGALRARTQRPTFRLYGL